MTCRGRFARVLWRWLFLGAFLGGTGLWNSRGQTSKIVYQGKLTDAGAAATGAYSMRFVLYDSGVAGAGKVVGTPVDLATVLVKEGAFTATLDFGEGTFDGSARFLEISVRPVGGVGALTLLTPRQEIVAVPYAIRSLSETSSGGGINADAQGNVAIGTNAVPSGVRMHVGGSMRVSPGGSGGFLQVGTPNGETGLTLSGRNRLDMRFDGETATFAAGANGGPPAPWNGITFNTNGNVGIGVTILEPKSLWKLSVDGLSRFRPAGDTGGAIQLSTPNGETGLSILRNNRMDLRFDDRTVKLVAGPGNGTPGNANGLAVTLAGDVGVGTVSPFSKLDVKGDITGTRLILRGDPDAPMNAAVLTVDPGVTNFIPYNTARGHAMNLVVHDATVRTLTILGGADFAEPFEVQEGKVEEGSVVVIDAQTPGRLRLSRESYDKRVAGVVSGANGVRPGITLKQEGVLEHGEMVALTGRVYVKATAVNGAIEPGDMVTTSDTPGYAMKATDVQRRQGAVLGKAMSGLQEGRGMVLVLVTLQ